MTPRLASLSLVSLLLCTACPSDDEGGDSTGGSETAADTGSETGADTTETGADTTETGAACGVAAGVCCAELEECQTTEDCCDPETYTCTLEAASTKCIDLAKMCETCVTNCEGAGVPPDVCAMSCAQWCNP
ncbi:hypothetical protein ACNOYE_17085 [Nannocystaceae bacterium ST9]